MAILKATLGHAAASPPLPGSSRADHLSALTAPRPLRHAFSSPVLPGGPARLPPAATLSPAALARACFQATDPDLVAQAPPLEPPLRGPAELQQQAGRVARASPAPEEAAGQHAWRVGGARGSLVALGPHRKTALDPDVARSVRTR